MSEAYTQLFLIATEKRCKSCGEMKSLVEYSRHPHTRDRLQPSCKACASAFRRQYYTENGDEIRAKARAQSHEHYVANREKERARAAERYRKDRESILRKNQEWRKRNPDKARAINRRTSPAKRKAIHYAWVARKKANGGTFTDAEWVALCERYDNRCLCCGEQKPLTADHVIPLSKGGSNYITNIQPLCQSCNSSKGTKETDYRR